MVVAHRLARASWEWLADLICTCAWLTDTNVLQKTPPSTRAPEERHAYSLDVEREAQAGRGAAKEAETRFLCYG